MTRNLLRAGKDPNPRKCHFSGEPKEQFSRWRRSSGSGNTEGPEVEKACHWKEERATERTSGDEAAERQCLTNEVLARVKTLKCFFRVLGSL